MQQRYYDPVIGRLLSRDEVTAYEKPLTNFNAYVYALNNPYRFTDPDGRDSASCYSSGGCGGNNSFYASQEKLGELADFTPIVGDVKGFVDAYNNPSIINVAAAIVGLVPEVGDFAAKGLKAAARDTTTVIGKIADLGNLRKGERTLLDRLPDRGRLKANWTQNSSVLREEMGRGVPIRDASVNSKGELINNTGFLRAERNLLESKGWTYDQKTTSWKPPLQ